MAAAWQRAIVVGASSGIGRATALALAREGVAVALVARRAAELERVAAEAPGARVYPHDVTRADDVAPLVERIAADLGEPDLLVYAAGVMPRIRPDEWDLGKDQAAVAVNLVGAIAWVNVLAPRFAAAGRGTIVGVSSVAGDRGRRGFPVYNATKAALDVYLEAVRHRVARHGVRVVVVKPGPVDTPMTQGIDRRPLVVPPERVARDLLGAARRGARTAYVPAVWRPIMLAIRNIPGRLFDRLDL
jgi:short-subunit dehydrogenase